MGDLIKLAKYLALNGFALKGGGETIPLGLPGDHPHAVLNGKGLKWHIPYSKMNVLQQISSRDEFRDLTFTHTHVPVTGFTVMHTDFNLDHVPDLNRLMRFLKSGALCGFKLESGHGYIFPKLLHDFLVSEGNARLMAENRIKIEVTRQHIATHDALLVNTKGTLLCAQGDVVGAAQCFSHAVELDNHFAEPFSNMGTILWDNGKQDEAFLMFRQAFLRLPVDPDIQQNFMDAGTSLGRFAEMENCFVEVQEYHAGIEGIHHLASLMKNRAVGSG